MKAIGMYIFGGSQTIGHLLEGWEIDTVLEMTDNMLSQNSYHFTKNYPNINVKLPCEYVNNTNYFNKLKEQNYDLLFTNPPCSGLSQINRNASADNNTNQHIYNAIKNIMMIEPKTFLIENAPTLVTTGLPILKHMVKEMSNKYRFLIITDLAGNHNVAMNRRRTLVVGFHRDIFSKIPKLNIVSEQKTVSDVLAELSNNCDNLEYESRVDESHFQFYSHVSNNNSLYCALAKSNLDLEKLPLSISKPVIKLKDKLDKNLNIWDKSPWRAGLDSKFPSLTSLTRIIHPTENRELYIGEYAAIMGYPDDFIFYKECKTNPIQCIAQGVPVNFIRYISKEIMNSFNATDFYDGDVVYINQANVNNIRLANYLTLEDFYNTTKIDVNNK